MWIFVSSLEEEEGLSGGFVSGCSFRGEEIVRYEKYI